MSVSFKLRIMEKNEVAAKLTDNSVYLTLLWMALAWDGWFTLVVIAMMFVLLCFEIYSPSIIIFGALIILWNAEILPTSDALSGFSNGGMLTVGALLVVVQTFDRTGLISRICNKVFGKSKNPRVGLVRMMIVVNILSAFLNNTPLVAMMMPILRDWARSQGFAPSKFLIPLAYAAVTGGLCTIIGTSTNLVIQGLIIKNGLPPIGFFELGYVGFPVAAVAIFFIAAVQGVLLPDTGGGLFRITKEKGGSFLTEVEILDSFPYIGHRVLDELKKIGISSESVIEILRPRHNVIESNAILSQSSIKPQLGEGNNGWRTPTLSRHASQEEPTEAGAGVVEIELQETRSGESVSEAALSQHYATPNIFTRAIEESVEIEMTYSRILPVTADEFFQSGDRLVVALQPEQVKDVVRVPGIRQMDHNLHDIVGLNSELFEVVISPRCPLIGKDYKGSNLGELYDCSLIAARRGGQGEIYDHENIKFEVGDTLLVLGKPDFHTKYAHHSDFFVCVSVGGLPKPVRWLDYIPLIIFVAMFVLASADVVSMERASMTAALLVVLGKWISPKEAIEAVDWDLLFMIGSSISVSFSMERSGVAREISNMIVGSGNVSPWGAYHFCA